MKPKLISLCSKGKETPSLKHRWSWTEYPCGYRQCHLYISSGYLLLPGDFWHKIWNFLRTKMPLSFTERHQFYWDQSTMEKVASTILVADHYKCPAILCQYLHWVDLFYCLDFWLSMQDLRYILRLFDFISDWPYRHGLKVIQGLLEIWAEHSKKLK